MAETIEKWADNMSSQLQYTTLVALDIPVRSNVHCSIWVYIRVVLPFARCCGQECPRSALNTYVAEHHCPPLSCSTWPCRGCAANGLNDPECRFAIVPQSNLGPSSSRRAGVRPEGAPRHALDRSGSD